MAYRVDPDPSYFWRQDAKHKWKPLPLEFMEIEVKGHQDGPPVEYASVMQIGTKETKFPKRFLEYLSPLRHISFLVRYASGNMSELLDLKPTSLIHFNGNVLLIGIENGRGSYLVHPKKGNRNVQRPCTAFI